MGFIVIIVFFVLSILLLYLITYQILFYLYLFSFLNSCGYDYIQVNKRKQNKHHKHILILIKNKILNQFYLQKVLLWQRQYFHCSWTMNINKHTHFTKRKKNYMNKIIMDCLICWLRWDPVFLFFWFLFYLYIVVFLNYFPFPSFYSISSQVISFEVEWSFVILFISFVIE